MNKAGGAQWVPLAFSLYRRTLGSSLTESLLNVDNEGMSDESPIILAIEDDKHFQSAYQKKLEKEGYTVLSALSGEEALDILEKVTPALIILDILLLGELNGYDVLERIQTHPEWSQCALIVVSNLNPTPEMLAALNDPSYYLIKSDVSLKDIVKTINSLLS